LDPNHKDAHRLAEKHANNFSRGKDLWKKARIKIFGNRMKKLLLAELVGGGKVGGDGSYSSAHLAPPLRTTVQAGEKLNWAAGARREGEEHLKREEEAAKEKVIHLSPPYTNTCDFAYPCNYDIFHSYFADARAETACQDPLWQNERHVWRR
jgi:hypothetical protein